MRAHSLKLGWVQVDVNKVWLTFSSIILAFSFMFGTSIANMYQAVVFLFVVSTCSHATTQPLVSVPPQEWILPVRAD